MASGVVKVPPGLPRFKDQQQFVGGRPPPLKDQQQLSLARPTTTLLSGRSPSRLVGGHSPADRTDQQLLLAQRARALASSRTQPPASDEESLDEKLASNAISLVQSVSPTPLKHLAALLELGHEGEAICSLTRLASLVNPESPRGEGTVSKHVSTLRKVGLISKGNPSASMREATVHTFEPALWSLWENESPELSDLLLANRSPERGFSTREVAYDSRVTVAYDSHANSFTKQCELNEVRSWEAAVDVLAEVLDQLPPEERLTRKAPLLCALEKANVNVVMALPKIAHLIATSPQRKRDRGSDNVAALLVSKARNGWLLTGPSFCASSSIPKSASSPTPPAPTTPPPGHQPVASSPSEEVQLGERDWKTNLAGVRAVKELLQ